MTTNDELVRKQFEAWASINDDRLKSIERNQHGNYILMQTASAWITWQAAAKATAKTRACITKG